MKTFLASKYPYLALRLILGGLFVYAGALKAADPGGFAQAIDEFGLVTWSMANLLARTLPIVEIVAGLGLIFDMRGALGLIVAQLLGFMIVIGYAIHMGLDVDCGCFGSSDPQGGEFGGLWEALIRDMLMFAACLTMYWQRRVAEFAPRPLFNRNPLQPKE